MGIGWSLDDFGTGFSSLSFLHRLQVNTVKVDRSFVSEIGTGAQRLGDGPRDRRAGAHARHGRGRGRRRDGGAGRRRCEALGCEYAQGYFFSKAVDRGTAARLIESQPWQAPPARHISCSNGGIG